MHASAGKEGSMDKATHFLWIVQTVILANAVNLTSQPVRAKVYRDEISASGVFIAMDEAVRASQMIPDSITAAEAANQFCTYVLRNLREPEERAKGLKASVPSWLAIM
jgi:hypothetical protein